jgi:hypothetical protein
MRKWQLSLRKPPLGANFLLPKSSPSFGGACPRKDSSLFFVKKPDGIGDLDTSRFFDATHKTGQIQLANYQEIRIHQFHQTMDKYLAK